LFGSKKEIVLKRGAGSISSEEEGDDDGLIKIWDLTAGKPRH
jgi:hypothetical protein